MATAATAQPSSPIHSAPNPSTSSQSQAQPNPNSANAQPINARSTVVHTYGPVSTTTATTTTANANANAAATPGSTSSIAGTTPGSAAGSTTGSTCDNCHRRKSRCAMNEMVNKCYSCDFHRQDCTFSLSDPNPSQKRKIEDQSNVGDQATKRLSKDFPYSPLSGGTMSDISQQHSALDASLLQSSRHIGMTTELETLLLDFLPLDANDEGLVGDTKVRKLCEDGTFLRMPDRSQIQVASDSLTVSIDAVESMVVPFGQTLVELFFHHVHPTFPVLTEDAFRLSHRTRRGLSPLLLSAVYVLALKWLDPLPKGQQTTTANRAPDAARLQSTALTLLGESLPNPQMSTVQAGLLLSQQSSFSTATLSAQLVTAGFELGLHQDCSTWKIDDWEKGLRMRLAWALYIQDKWTSLVLGRPSHIFDCNWAVKDLDDQDFEGAYSDGSANAVRGPLLFMQFVSLTTILSDILDNFYTLKAIQTFTAAGNQRTRLILDRAKPVQIRLKDWFAHLPSELRMDTSTSNFSNDAAFPSASSNGSLHLAYFATEITLHRCIIRSLASCPSTDQYLSHICRSAAKTRLISAMDFINRLRPAHLHAFWPAASRTNFALIGTFGILLLVTAPTREEADFYDTRLGEFRWTLSVSRRNAEFLNFAVESLDMGVGLVAHVPEKPEIGAVASRGQARQQREQHQFRRKQRSRNHRRQRTHSRCEGSTTDTFDPGRGGSSSGMSGLASPATSTSSGLDVRQLNGGELGSMHDVEMLTLDS